MESFMQTKTPSLLDIPYFFLKTSDLKAQLTHKQRTILLVRGSFYYETPIATAGFHHNKTMNISLDAQLNMKSNIQTMEHNTELEMSKLPEVVTVESETEMFVRYMDRNENDIVKFTYRRMPASFEYNLNKYKMAPNTMKQQQDNEINPEEVHSVFRFRLPNLRSPAYLTTRSQGGVIVDNSPHEWVIVPAPTNNQIVSLYSPKMSAYVFYDATSKDMKMSKVKRTYFFMNFTRDGHVTFESLVPVKISELPKDAEQRVNRVSKMVDEMRQAQLEDKEMERAFKMINEDFVSNAVDVMHMYYNEVSRTLEMTRETAPTFFLPEIQQLSKQNFDKEMRKIKNCNSKWIPFCPYGVWSYGQASKVTEKFFQPMVWGLMNKQDEQKFTFNVVPSGSDETKKYNFKLTSPTQETFEMSWSHDTESRKMSFDVHQPTERGTNQQDKMICLRFEYPRNTFQASISFAEDCRTHHLKLNSKTKDNSSPKEMRSLFSIDFDWLVRYDDSFPTSSKEFIKDLYESYASYFMEKSWWNQQLRYFKDEQSEESEQYQGDGNIYLTSPTKLRLRINNTRHTCNYNMQLPTPLERIPYGSQHFTRAGQVASYFNKPVCIHRRNFFQTFDQVKFTYQIPNEKCEHVLVKTCSNDVPKMQVLVKKENQLKHIRILIQSSVIKIQPTSFSEIPEVIVDGERRTNILSNEKTDEIALPNKMTVEFIWVSETYTLFVINKELGFELKMVAGQSLFVRMSSLLFGKVCGLCGDMNSEQDMELRTPEMVEVKDPNLFGFSWLVAGEQCSNQGCPFEGKKKMRVQVDRQTCTTQVAIPQCFSKCQSTKKKTFQNIPVTCRNQETKMAAISASVDCRCPC